VLNASRHHRYFHQAQSFISCTNFSCSTPRGITGTFTAGVPRDEQRIGCAQRLAASQVLSHNFNVIRLASSVCSTPRGITGTFTASSVIIESFSICAQRLAASQVLSPAFYFLFSGGALCAQRLAASQVLSPLPSRELFERGSCAQRLAASQVLSPFYRFRLRWTDYVLNASRHHRYFHLERHAREWPGVRVLNASRHHRYFHKLRSSKSSALALGCSTPRGITGTFTSRRS